MHASLPSIRMLQIGGCSQRTIHILVVATVAIICRSGSNNLELHFIRLQLIIRIGKGDWLEIVITLRGQPLAYMEQPER